ncbi:hypothetical protein ACLOJK_011775 [Asimina triloba]
MDHDPEPSCTITIAVNLFPPRRPLLHCIYCSLRREIQEKELCRGEVCGIDQGTDEWFGAFDDKRMEGEEIRDGIYYEELEIGWMWAIPWGGGRENIATCTVASLDSSGSFLHPIHRSLLIKADARIPGLPLKGPKIPIHGPFWFLPQRSRTHDTLGRALQNGFWSFGWLFHVWNATAFGN